MLLIVLIYNVCNIISIKSHFITIATKCLMNDDRMLEMYESKTDTGEEFL